MSSAKKDFLNRSTVDEIDSQDSLIEVSSTYVPGPTAQRVHHSSKKIRLLRGGLGCIRESSRILTQEGYRHAGEISGPTHYLSLQGKEPRWSLGTAPFPKGKANLYQVVHTRGRFVAAAHHLVLCSDGNYRPISELQAGDALASLAEESAYLLAPLHSSSGSSRLTSLLDVRHWIQRLAGYLDGCGESFRLHGLQPLLESGPCPAFPLSPDDARELFRTLDSSYRRPVELREEQQARRNHLDLLSGRLGKTGFAPQWAGPVSAWANHFLGNVSAHISPGTQRLPQSHERCEPHPRASLLGRDHTSIVDSSLWSCSESTILAIERLPKSEWYWDLQVPGDNNYFAEGAIHHNSGKTRCGVEHINFLANTFPGSLHLIARKDITSLKVTTQREFEKIVIPETIKAFNAHDNNLYYKNGSMIIFRETKDPKKVLSLELTSFMLDEVDENEYRDIVDNLERRLRQKVLMDGEWVTPPYAGLCVFNPVPKSHWLYELSQEENVDDIQFSTYENAANLPDNYISDLERRFAKAPWEINRLLKGEWGIEVKGKPVIHSFGTEHVRPLELRRDLPVVRCWDFGFGHPCVKLAQFDPKVGKHGRWMLHRELLGHNEKLVDFAPKAIKLTKELCEGIPIIDFGDTHGSDHKDVGDTSIDTLKTKFNIYVNHGRQRIKTGVDDIQILVTETAALYEDDPKLYPCFLVDPMCPNSIDAYTYGYHKGQDGLPVKDGFFDHFVDADRYGVIGMRGRAMGHRRPKTKYQPRNKITGY